MVISHLPYSNLRAWLLVKQKSRQMSTPKSKQCCNWMCCLRGFSSLKEISLDESWSYSHLTVGPKGIRASHGTLNNIHGASDEVATYAAVAGKTMGGWSMFCHVSSLVAQTNLDWALQDSQLSVPNSHYFIQGAHNLLWHTYQNVCSHKKFPNIIHEMMRHSMSCLTRYKQSLAPTLRPLVERIYNYLAHIKPYPLCCSKTGSPAHNPTFYHLHCSYQMGAILYYPGKFRYTSCFAKIFIFCSRVFCCHPLPGRMEEKLGGTWSCPKQNGHGRGSTTIGIAVWAQKLTA